MSDIKTAGGTLTCVSRDGDHCHLSSVEIPLPAAVPSPQVSDRRLQWTRCSFPRTYIFIRPGHFFPTAGISQGPFGSGVMVVVAFGLF